MQTSSNAADVPKSAKPNKQHKLSTQLQRDEYGAICAQVSLSEVGRTQLRDILASAVKSGQLYATYLHRSRRELECLNHDVYDLLLERGRISAVIVQERTLWKDLRKTRTRVTKRYVLLARERRTLRAEELDKATCLRRAKNTTKLGELVQHYVGKKSVRCMTPRAVVKTGYKVLARDADGTLRSVFDSTE